MFVYFTMLWNCLCISPCCAIVCEFHHVVQLFVYFIMLCNCLYISSCCAIVCAFHHVVQLFVHFTMLCNCLWILQCCAIVLEFHHVLIVSEYWSVVECYCGVVVNPCHSMRSTFWLVITHSPTEPFPELLPQLKICRPNFDSVLYNFVQYGTVQYRVPPPDKSENFFLCISGWIRPFPMFSHSF